MSERLSKLVDYINNQNYEMAIATYTDSTQKLSEPQILQMARAFFVIQNYTKCLDLIAQISNNCPHNIKYESFLLKAKSLYFIDNMKESQKVLQHLLQNINKQIQKYTPYHKQRVSSLLDCYTKQLSLNKPMKMTKNQLRNFGRRFMKQLEQSQNESLMMGMPMFIVSEKWFHRMKKYLGVSTEEQGDYPGFITHFEIVDDRFQLLSDPTPQKAYTNVMLYPSVRVKVLQKPCWLLLRQIFQGKQIKRFNISALGKINQIMTQIYLKQIKIKREGSQQVYMVQISKKENWQSVMKKLKAIWNYDGGLYEIDSMQQKKFVSAKTILQEVDTADKIYWFSQEPLNDQAQANKKQFKCNFCKKTDNLKFCQCKTVKYCDIQCLKEDRKNHKKKCDLEMEHIKQKAATLENFELDQKDFGGKKGIVGLRNLGNTCYMNSGLQCLSNTKEITLYFMSNQFFKDINHSNTLGTKGNLACAYAQLIRQMWTGKQSYQSPFKLKKIIGKFATQFSGFGQQDSQELISYLLDGLQEDLNLIKHKETFEVKDEILPDEQASLISQMNYAKRIKSYIRSLMAGQFKSTVVCSKCSRKSICFDPYMLITLPIPTVRKEEGVYYIAADHNHKTMKININYDAQTTFGEVKKQMESFYRIPKSRGHWLQACIVCLDNKQLIEKNIKDQVLFLDKVQSLEDSNIFFYEFVKPQYNEKLYQVDVFFKNSKINIPKFSNIDPQISSKKLSEILAPIIDRFYNGGNPLEIYLEPPTVNGSNIAMNLRKDLDMLKCKSQLQSIKLGRDKKLTLDYCLKNFAVTETLQKNNEWYCNKCKKFVKASKQMEIYKTSKILVMAFKRFSRGWKVKSSIDYPIDGLNMGPYIKSHKSDSPIYYDLYGVVNHYGTMFGGHYTAFCKNFLNNRWYQFDDSRVSQIRNRDIVSESTYVLFYRLRDN